MNWTHTFDLYCIQFLFQVPAPDHLRPLPGDDAEDCDGKAAQLHLRAVCNGERLGRLRRHQPLHHILCQQLRQRDTHELCERLACQAFMYDYSTCKPSFHLMNLYPAAIATNPWLGPSIQMSETACRLGKRYNIFVTSPHLSQKMNKD